MTAYLVTYDLKDPSCEQELLDYLRDELDAAKITESSYLVITERDKKGIVADIRRITGDRIDVYVLGVNGWAGYGPTKVNEMLHQKLG